MVEPGRNDCEPVKLMRLITFGATIPVAIALGHVDKAEPFQGFSRTSVSIRSNPVMENSVFSRNSYTCA